MSITHIDDLPSLLSADEILQASMLIVNVYASAEKHIYSRDTGFRLAAYAAMIDWACEAALDDGGPAVALWLLKRASDQMRGEAAVRARTQVGPFLDAPDLKRRLAGAIAPSAERKLA